MGGRKDGKDEKDGGRERETEGERERRKREGGGKERMEGGWEGKKGKEEALLPVYDGQMRALKCQPVTLKVSNQIL